MAKVGAQRAAELTGRSKSTIQRAMNTGKLSYEMDANGRRLIDVSELERALGLASNAGSSAARAGSVEEELEKVTAMLETERLKMRIKSLEDQLDNADAQIADLKEQRDQWQRQASQTLITSQYSQKQAEDLREELKERERRAIEARERRQMEMRKRQPQNENTMNAESEAENFKFKTLWKRVKGAA